MGNDGVTALQTQNLIICKKEMDEVHLIEKKKRKEKTFLDSLGLCVFEEKKKKKGSYQGIFQKLTRCHFPNKSSAPGVQSIFSFWIRNLILSA